MASFLSTTLLHLLRKNNEVIETLLAYQTRVIIGRKSYGGKIELGQSAVSNMEDETIDESGKGIMVNKKSIKIYGKINFYNHPVDQERLPPGHPSTTMFCGVTWDFSGEPKETEEMIDPRWYPIDNLPFDEMIMGDSLYIPFLIQEKFFKGDIHRLAKKVNGNYEFIRIIPELTKVEECSEKDLSL